MVKQVAAAVKIIMSILTEDASGKMNHISFQFSVEVKLGKVNHNYNQNQGY
jgi:hypothetical protein